MRPPSSVRQANSGGCAATQGGRLIGSKVQLCCAIFLFSVTLAFVQAQQIVPSSLSASSVTRVSADPLGRDSPQGTVVGFLQSCRTHDYSQATAYLDLRVLTTAQRLVEGPKLARQLEQLLDSNKEFEAGSLSRDPNSSSGTGSREIVATFLDAGRRTNLDLERVKLGPDSTVLGVFVE